MQRSDTDNLSRQHAHFTGPKAAILTLGACLTAETAWAGPYSSGNFALYGLYICIYLAPPAIAILTLTKAFFWSRLAIVSAKEQFLILKIAASLILSFLEFASAAVTIVVIAAIAQTLPVLVEVDRYTIWGALAGWGLFFLFLGLLDIRNNNWLLKRAQVKHPDKTFPEKAVLIGAAALWSALVLLSIVVMAAYMYDNNLLLS